MGIALALIRLGLNLVAKGQVYLEGKISSLLRCRKLHIC
jgi:hypothetical protein